MALGIILGVALGSTAPSVVGALSRLELHHVNLPIAVLIWLMIYPMMRRIDFTALSGVGRRPKGLVLVRFVNWLVKPFSMAFLGWLFFKPRTGAALATVVGVLVEVPVMLSVCSICNRTRHWFGRAAIA